MFQTLAGILGETDPEPSFSLMVHDHLSLLLKEFEHYFPNTQDSRTGKEWTCDPFVNKPGESSMSVQEEDQLLEIANDGGLKTTFEATTLPVFRIEAMAEYPEIATTAFKTLLPFPSSYLCEVEFSAVTATKTKQRNKLDLSNTLWVSLSPITLRWNRLVAEKQAQGSH
ncbi:SCAN domain-containing protein 3-like [Oratosquilla oratoria]|uniref:SCAN domain-containing protein 3-like n=1 Tax=Oratosquilla oratoria TaxID=337810 RepID=UPI003F759BC4